jgi:hypothetical protein
VDLCDRPLCGNWQAQLNDFCWPTEAFCRPDAGGPSSGRSAHASGSRATPATALHAITARASALGNRPIFGRSVKGWSMPARVSVAGRARDVVEGGRRPTLNACAKTRPVISALASLPQSDALRTSASRGPVSAVSRPPRYDRQRRVISKSGGTSDYGNAESAERGKQHRLHGPGGLDFLRPRDHTCRAK